MTPRESKYTKYHDIQRVKRGPRLQRMVRNALLCKALSILNRIEAKADHIIVEGVRVNLAGIGSDSFNINQKTQIT